MDPTLARSVKMTTPGTFDTSGTYIHRISRSRRPSSSHFLCIPCNRRPGGAPRGIYIARSSSVADPGYPDHPRPKRTSHHRHSEAARREPVSFLVDYIARKRRPSRRSCGTFRGDGSGCKIALRKTTDFRRSGTRKGHCHRGSQIRATIGRRLGHHVIENVFCPTACTSSKERDPNSEICC